jgi:hypothetical protein
LGFFLWTLGGSCFVLFFDKNLRVYKNVLSFWGFSENILWSFTTKGKKRDIHYYKMWVRFTSPHSLDQWIHCFSLVLVHYN